MITAEKTQTALSLSRFSGFPDLNPVRIKNTSLKEGLKAYDISESLGVNWVKERGSLVLAHSNRWSITGTGSRGKKGKVISFGGGGAFVFWLTRNWELGVRLLTPQQAAIEVNWKDNFYVPSLPDDFYLRNYYVSLENCQHIPSVSWADFTEDFKPIDYLKNIQPRYYRAHKGEAKKHAVDLDFKLLEGPGFTCELFWNAYYHLKSHPFLKSYIGNSINDCCGDWESAYFNLHLKLPPEALKLENQGFPKGSQWIMTNQGKGFMKLVLDEIEIGYDIPYQETRKKYNI